MNARLKLLKPLNINGEDHAAEEIVSVREGLSYKLILRGEAVKAPEEATKTKAEEATEMTLPKAKYAKAKKETEDEVKS
ncbi:MAG: hypothetical protein LBT81_02290 [Helicobacteraceae bacterium]|jgi:hypothetical protein|nr:hypothetical protein [Helicobacteraceae bacterium]